MSIAAGPEKAWREKAWREKAWREKAWREKAWCLAIDLISTGTAKTR